MATTEHFAPQADASNNTDANNSPDTAPAAENSVKVWDPLVRLFHWSLVVAFSTAYISSEFSDDIHVIAGYTVTCLIVFRLVWGIIGTPYARFSQFVRSPKAVWHYLVALPAGKARRYLGHNPAGGAMIVALLIALSGTVILGMATLGAEEQAGPLAGSWIATIDEHTLEEVHEFFANSTLLLVLLHLAGVLFSSLAHKENLVRSMIHGRKDSRDDDL